LVLVVEPNPWCGGNHFFLIPDEQQYRQSISLAFFPFGVVRDGDSDEDVDVSSRINVGWLKVTSNF
jgi:hypothetical protein